jgi:hypothetical protein
MKMEAVRAYPRHCSDISPTIKETPDLISARIMGFVTENPAMHLPNTNPKLCH